MRDWLVPVDRLRSDTSGVDAFGEPIPGGHEVTNLPPAFFAPGGSVERLGPGVDTVTTSPCLYWRGAWPDLVAGDRVFVRGRVWEVDGDPQEWPAGLVAVLKGVGRE